MCRLQWQERAKLSKELPGHRRWNPDLKILRLCLTKMGKTRLRSLTNLSNGEFQEHVDTLVRNGLLNVEVESVQTGGYKLTKNPRVYLRIWYKTTRKGREWLQQRGGVEEAVPAIRIYAKKL